MQRAYAENESVRQLCRKLMALALMPRNEVTNAFNSIRADADQLDGHPMADLLSYFETHWMSDIDLWNVSTCDSRTNNVCEGRSQKEMVTHSVSSERLSQ